ncbi:MAG: nucleotidyltransferase domain-containing protein [FCB group bacterium]|nr:nucleotidyltransferase domain-containing protein [FCB group bacterium]
MQINGHIQQVVNQVSQKFDPDKIILFGSQAYGKVTRNSDVDLLVVMNFEGSARRQAATILMAIDYHIALDLLVRSKDQISTRIKAGDFFIQEIIEKGIVLYERNSS